MSRDEAALIRLTAEIAKLAEKCKGK